MRRALNRRLRSAWCLCSGPSFDPDEDDKKIPHTAALKRVTEPTRQKRREERKLTNRGEDIVGSSQSATSRVLQRDCSGHLPVHQEFPWWGEGPNSIKIRSHDMTMLGLAQSLICFQACRDASMGRVPVADAVGGLYGGACCQAEEVRTPGYFRTQRH